METPVWLSKLANHSLLAKFGQLPDFVNEIILEHSYALVKCISCGCFVLQQFIETLRPKVWDILWPTEPEIFTTWTFTEKICQLLALIDESREQQI